MPNLADKPSRMPGRRTASIGCSTAKGEHNPSAYAGSLHTWSFLDDLCNPTVVA